MAKDKEINNKDEKGNTKLHNAILACDLEQVENLIAQGADYKIEDKNGDSSSILAVRKLIIQKQVLLKMIASNDLTKISKTNKNIEVHSNIVKASIIAGENYRDIYDRITTPKSIDIAAKILAIGLLFKKELDEENIKEVKEYIDIYDDILVTALEGFLNKPVNGMDINSKLELLHNNMCKTGLIKLLNVNSETNIENDSAIHYEIGKKLLEKTPTIKNLFGDAKQFIESNGVILEKTIMNEHKAFNESSDILVQTAENTDYNQLVGDDALKTTEEM